MKRFVLVCVSATILAVSASAVAATCAETKFDEMSAYMLLGWGAWNGTDRDWDGIPDEFAGALACTAMCEDPAIQAVYDANLAAAHTLVDGDSDWWFNYYGWALDDASAPQIAAYAMWDTDANMILWFWWYAGDMGVFELVPSLADDGDYDGDGQTNLEEYEAVAALGGGPEMYAAAASTNGPFWPGNPELPVAGFVGLALLAASCIAGGALSLRKK